MACNGKVELLSGCGGCDVSFANDADGEFAAHSHTDVPRLLDSLDAEEAENARLRELVGALKDLSQCETNYRLTGEEIRDWEKLEGKAPEGLKDALTKFLSERCDLINRIVELEAAAPQPQGCNAAEAWEKEKESLRKQFCGSICHGDDFTCFYQGGDTWNPCSLATEEDKKAFLATVPEYEDETAKGGAQ